MKCCEMKSTIVASLLFSVLFSGHLVAGQVVAGTPEDKFFQQVVAEKNQDAKLKQLAEFEKQFPHSKVLPDVYLMIIDLYREKGDRTKIIEYGEKTLEADEKNLTAMMVLSRNYAIEGKNLDRAVMLAEKAVDALRKMKTQTMPISYTEAQWKDYLQSTEGAAQSILEYARSIRGK